MVKDIGAIYSREKISFEERLKIVRVIQMRVVCHDFKEMLKDISHAGPRFQVKEFHHGMPVCGKLMDGCRLFFLKG